MGLTRYILCCGCLFWLALLAPISLPAGGANLNQFEIRRREGCEPFIALKSCDLLVTPFIGSSPVAELHIGTPLRLLRSWQNNDGATWIHVEIIAGGGNYLEDISRRGWLNV
mgnify:CR=1 FL=1